MKWMAPLEKIYHAGAAVKRALTKDRVVLPVPVISVGNLSFGGTGKTPCVIWLAEELAKEKKVVVITRSYRGSLSSPQRVDIAYPGIYGDEACLIQAKLPQVMVWSGPDKSATAEACMQDKPDVVIVDDGFSHYKLKRNFDLVLVDATRGFSDYLREPLSALQRANAVILTKSNLTTEPLMKGENIFSAEAVTSLHLEKGTPIYVFCALARPEGFVLALEKMGYRVQVKRFFRDHHFYTESEQADLLASEYQLVTTEKDFVKLTNPELKRQVKVAGFRMQMTEEKKGALLAKIRKSF